MEDSTKVILQTCHGNPFLFDGEQRSFIDVRTGGYIITPDGQFVPVRDRCDHGDVFSLYLTNYLESDQLIQENSIDAAIHLSDLGHIVYFGLKLNDISVQNSTPDGSYASSPEHGYGVLIFPQDLDCISREQSNGTLDLLETNHGRWSDEPLFNLTFSRRHKELTLEDQYDLLTHLKKKAGRVVKTKK